ncbi:MAG: hypothetical protein WAO08_20325 [Hyphomicrobiaceae bacterium]
MADIDTALVLKVLEQIWQTKTESASRVRGRIERVLSAAKVRGLRDGEIPALWRGHLDQIAKAIQDRSRQTSRSAALQRPPGIHGAGAGSSPS